MTEDPRNSGKDAPRPRRRPTIGTVLLVLGTSVWAAWAYLKWGPDPGGPGLAVVEREPSSEPPEPAVARESEPSSAVASGSSDRDEGAESPKPETGPTWKRPALDPDWYTELDPAPEEVRYSIQHGGSLRNVANLYKIFHHRIQELNPGSELDEELAPGTSVVVYRGKDGAGSESVGYPSDGSLKGGVPLMGGPGRILKAIPWKRWGTEATIMTIDRVLRQWAKRHPDADPILVGNISAPEGGRLRPHSTHQSGRDVDLGYPQKPGVEREYNWREMSERNLDVPRTWELLEILAQTRGIEVIFIDRSLQALLHDYALEQEKMDKDQLARWLEYPRSVGTADDALVRHVPGHVDHLHVRVACPPEQERCKSR